MADDVSIPETTEAPPAPLVVPAPTESAPAEPAPTASMPAEPAPAEPAPTEATAEEPIPIPVPAPESVAAVKIESEPPASLADLAETSDNKPDESEEPDEAPEEESESEPVEPAVVEEKPPENPKRWYVVKVQSGREDTIKEAIERRVRKERLEEFYGQIVIPVEKVTEVKTDKNGKRVTRTKERKLYPGYLMCEVEYNDRILYLFRETSGVGDFVGAQPGNLDRPPTPMSDREIQRMLGPKHDQDEPKVAPPPRFAEVGEKVRVVDGTFNGMEGVVKAVHESVSKVQVTLTIFGRPVDVDLEYYQVEQA